MNYLSPVEYSKKMKALMEDESIATEDAIPVKGKRSMKERLSELSPDNKIKLKEYVNAIKEIKKSIYELLNKEEIEEGGNVSNNLVMRREEE